VAPLTDRDRRSRDHGCVGRIILLVLCLSSVAFAEEAKPATPLCSLADDALLTLDEQWPQVPADHSMSLEDRITDKVTDAGNHVGTRLDQLSHHVARLHVDGRARRAQLHLGYGNEHLLVNFDSNWLFADGKAYIKAKLELALGDHHFELELPNMDLSHDNYKGEGMVEVNVSVLEKRF
jgi:hypothetical protein